MRGSRSRTTKLLLSASAVGCAAAVAGLGTFGDFTSTTSASASYTSGTVTIALGSAGTATNRLTIGATNIVPGDTIQRTVDLSNTGNTNLASVALTTTASPSSLLDTDATNGLQMVIDKCSVAWTEAGPPYTYTCSGSTSSVVGSRAVVGSGIAMSNLSALTAAQTDHLRVTLTFPSSAGNTLQTQSSTITFSFLGTQRSAGSQ